MSARYAPAERLLALALALSEARGGMTIEAMAVHLGVGRRTAERLRGALDRVLMGDLQARTDPDGLKRWRIPAGRLTAVQTPTLDELLELRLAADRARQQGLAHEAEQLSRLAAKLEARQTRAAFRPIEGNLSDLLDATGHVVRPGPCETIEPTLIQSLREAVLGCHVVQLDYRRRDNGQVSRPILHPYGFLTGARTYLVGFNPHPRVREHRLYALANIERVRSTETVFRRDLGFNLRAFANRSFGLFWDGEIFDVVWQFSPDVARDAQSFRFHPTQTITVDADGSVTVSFRASGLTEMAWHLVTWGEHVAVIAPEALQRRLRECLARSTNALNRGSVEIGMPR